MRNVFWRLFLVVANSIISQPSSYLPGSVQVQQLRHDQVGHVVVHGPPQAHDALREELRDNLLKTVDDDRIRRRRALLRKDELGEVAG